MAPDRVPYLVCDNTSVSSGRGRYNREKQANGGDRKSVGKIYQVIPSAEKIERERAKARQGTRSDIVATLPQSDKAKSRDIPPTLAESDYGLGLVLPGVALEERGIPESATIVAISENAARPLFAVKKEAQENRQLSE